MKPISTSSNLLRVALPRLFLLMVSALLASGCATTDGKTDICKGWHPIFLDHRDSMTDRDKQEVWNHNEYGVKMGCWKRPSHK